MNKDEIIGPLENITNLIDRVSSAKFISDHKLSYVDDKSVNRMRTVFSQNGFTMNSMLISELNDVIDTLKQYRFTVNDDKTAYSLFSFYINFNYPTNIFTTTKDFIPSYDSISWNSEILDLEKLKRSGLERSFSIFKGTEDGLIDSIKYGDIKVGFWDYSANCDVIMKKVKDNIWAISDYKYCFRYEDDDEGF